MLGQCHPTSPLTEIMSKAASNNEMLRDDANPRRHYGAYAQWLAAATSERLAAKRLEADALFHRLGITFAVYGEENGPERLIPFDIVPRIVPAEEWQGLSAGVKQRVRALNLFLNDIYHDQKILSAGLIPTELILGNSQYRPEMRGVDVAAGI